MGKRKNVGWRFESTRHALASYGINTTYEPLGKYEEDYFYPRMDEKRIKIWESWDEELQNNFVPITGMGFYDDCIGKKEDFERRKGKTYEIIYMNPERYKEIVVDRLKRKHKEDYYPGMAWDSAIDEGVIKELKQADDRFPMPTLEYDGDYFSQEGRHRTELMIEKGIDKMPVYVVWNVDDEAPLEEVKNRG